MSRRRNASSSPLDQFAGEKAGAILVGVLVLMFIVGVWLIISGLVN